MKSLRYRFIYLKPYLCLLEEEPNPHIKLVDEEQQIIKPFIS